MFFQESAQLGARSVNINLGFISIECHHLSVKITTDDIRFHR